MKQVFRNLLGAAVLLGSLSHAAVINFNALSGTFPTYTEQGVTFSAVGGGNLVALAGGPNGTVGILGGNSPRQEIRADIAGGTSSVAIDLGDFNQDADTLFLQISTAPTFR